MERTTGNQILTEHAKATSDRASREQKLEDDMDEDRRHVRNRLYADLNLNVEPEFYPKKPNDPDEPSLEQWREGYLKIKAYHQRNWDRLGMLAVGAAIIGILMSIVKLIYNYVK